MRHRSAYHRSKVAKTTEELAEEVAVIEAAQAVAKAPAASKRKKKVVETVKEDK